ncbi:MAG: DUF4032 domain-containing protein [Candidatus Cloacimonetes bacterium]|nr:DUF4032 domain-containing protein [Candidatus Cloacimonadota bacterium]
MDRIKLNITIKKEYYQDLSPLPWQKPLTEWKQPNISLVRARKGLARHEVIFIRVNHRKFAIKETTAEMACQENKIYEYLQKLNIPSLQPVGYVIRAEEPVAENTRAGIQYDQLDTGFLITRLEDKVIPESHLLRRNFSSVNRQILYRSIALLLARIHNNGIYWGDASLANLLLRFAREDIPGLGAKRIITATLADAETVEIKPGLAEALQENDLDSFFESIDWFHQDLLQAGYGGHIFQIDIMKDSIRQLYLEYRSIFQELNTFDQRTGLSLEKMMGVPGKIEYITILGQHIDAHKWYLSERLNREILLREAARDWYRNIFLPVCSELRQENILEYFPGKTAADLYVEIMTHKYFEASKAGHDIPLETAIKNYCQNFGLDISISSRIRNIIEKFLKIFE